MRIRELDGLRGIAALAVVSDHYLSWLSASGAQNGWLGVVLVPISCRMTIGWQP